ncbi:MAG: hypothetical protein DESF_02544 [Desulfovibrio sp.]
MVVHQNITNLAGYFHFLNVRKIPYVIIPHDLALAVGDAGAVRIRTAERGNSFGVK